MVTQNSRSICQRSEENLWKENLSLGEFHSLIFYANWENRCFSVAEECVGPVVINKKSIRIKTTTFGFSYSLLPSLLIIHSLWGVIQNMLGQNCLLLRGMLYAWEKNYSNVYIVKWV